MSAEQTTSPAEILPVAPRPREVYPFAPAGYAEGPGSAAEDRDSSSLLEYWRLLFRHKGTVLLAASLGGLAGYLSTLPETPIYQARTSIEIVALNDNFMNIGQVNPISENGVGYDTSEIQTHLKILQSDSLMDRVFAKMKKERPTDTAAAAPESRLMAWRRVLRLAPPAESGAVLDTFRGLRVRAAGQTRILEIMVDSTNPRDAAAFANAVATEFIDQSLEARWKTTQHTTEWLNKQLDDMRIKLERSEDGLQGYAARSGLMFTMEKNSVSEEKLTQLQKSLLDATAERITKQSRHEMAVSSPPEALPDVLNDPSLRDYQSKLTELRRQIAELAPTFTAEHPKVKRLEAQLVTFESALKRERADITRRIGNEYEEAKRKEALLAAAYAVQAAQVTGESEKSIKYNILKREVDSNRQLYDTMLSQLKQATIASAMRASNIRVVDTAKVPGGPYKPDPKRNAGMGLTGGLLLGAALVVLRERADRSIQQPGDSPLYLKMPELGIIPSIEGGMGRTSRTRSKKEEGQASLLLGGTVAIRQADERAELVTWQRKSSPFAESFRSLLVSILFSNQGSSRPRVIVLTSASPAEGKSTVVSNLGIAIAEVGHKVLIIDADMRKPRLQEIFGLPNDRGLSSILSERRAASGNASLAGLIRETEAPGLFVLTSGPSLVSATNLLYGPQMPSLLKLLRTEFDTILIDTPPMLQIPDARVVGRVSDGVILVIRAGKTSRNAAIAATQRFAEDGTQVLGTILNDWNPGSSRDGYYGPHGYHQYRGYYGQKDAAGS